MSKTFPKIAVAVAAIAITASCSQDKNYSFKPQGTPRDGTAQDPATGKTLYRLPVVQSLSNIREGNILIEEIFFTSNVLPATGLPDKYHGDQYFKITNNTRQTIDVSSLISWKPSSTPFRPIPTTSISAPTMRRFIRFTAFRKVRS